MKITKKKMDENDENAENMYGILNNVLVVASITFVWWSARNVADCRIVVLIVKRNEKIPNKTDPKTEISCCGESKHDNKQQLNWPNVSMPSI